MTTVAATKPPTNGTQPVPTAPVSLLKEFYWEPFTTMPGMRRMMDAFFDSMLPVMDVGPPLDVYEKDGVYTIECALPGYKKDGIVVEAKGNEITISGSYASEKSDEAKRFHAE